MDDNERNDVSVARKGIPRRRLLLLIGVTLTALVLFLGLFFRDGLWSRWRTEDNRSNRFPPDALLDYVPEDSEAVLSVDVRALMDSPVGRRLAPSLQQLLRRGGRRLRWMEVLGLNPFDDLDSLQMSFAPAAGGEPLWLMRGRLDPARIQRGPDKIQDASLDRFSVWEYTDRPAKRTTWLAPVGDTLVVSETPGRVLAALKQASAPRPITISDATLRELLTKVDRRQSLWLAVSIRSLGPIAGIEDPLLKLALRPLLAQAESVHGGITCAEDVQVELHFQAATEERAAKLETDLQSLREAAPGAALLLGRQKELLPLLKLLGSGKTSREGNEVHWRCRLAAEQLEN